MPAFFVAIRDILTVTANPLNLFDVELERISASEIAPLTSQTEGSCSGASVDLLEGQDLLDIGKKHVKRWDLGALSVLRGPNCNLCPSSQKYSWTEHSASRFGTAGWPREGEKQHEH
ncbi:predicted protein [Histoplasma capsulatum var. duboisii H88]|uniref:Predicted protein n=1 Tax=Ajellomyces capsulatus (strain H88) TaxID=544711 RepID=F0UN93_AJEC8|nr:predicted protein [Histoplasma capsulatum var. duboisii H88]